MKDLERSCLVCLQLFFTAQAALFERYIAKTGSKVDGDWHSLHNIDTISICCVSCSKDSNCIAVNHNPDTRICELLDKRKFETFSLTTSFGWNAFFTNIKDVNLLPNAIATQSSTFGDLEAERAIDGDTDGLKRTSYTHTNFEVDPWWMVDFQTVIPVSSIIMWNRLHNGCDHGKGCWLRLRYLLLTVASTENALNLANSICGKYAGPPLSSTDNPVRIDCERVMYGRFVRITKHSPDTGVLSLCEVQVI